MEQSKKCNIDELCEFLVIEKNEGIVKNKYVCSKYNIRLNTDSCGISILAANDCDIAKIN